MQNTIPPYLLESVRAFQPETVLTVTLCVAPLEAVSRKR